MKPHPRTDEQDDLLRPRLSEMIDLRTLKTLNNCFSFGRGSWQRQSGWCA